ncbi:hypothetical protein MMC25_000333 [Agyrium rufum]|nr:hypothetical protein [Agyrium rufum]
MEVDEKKQQLQKKRDLLKELDYLRDPVKLATDVVRRLKNNEAQHSLDLVRVASSRMSCVVSWNHLIDYQMAAGHTEVALKIYQEMKKRAQPPDAYTFTVLLRGLAMARSHPSTLEKALRIYESMYAENSPVRPTVLHVNAVLKVCARVHDIDAMFGIAAKMPNTGPGAANNVTFTTILNAIRYELWQENLKARDDAVPATADEKMREDAVRRGRAIQMGRRMWEDVINRWQDGDMFVDEELVCSLGRLLLLGPSSKDIDDIMSLVEQTMEIPRQLPALGDPKRQSHHRAIRAIDGNAAPEGVEDENDPENSENALDIYEAEDADTDTSFSKLHPSPTPRSLPRPGRNTLSLLMDACLQLRAPSAANAYRKLLTDPEGRYRVTPDTENLHTYLRLLRQSRSSYAAVKLVEDMIADPPPGPGVTAKTFRIAMSACVRDKKNRNIGQTAERLVQMMAKTLEEPDIQTCSMFIELRGDREVPWQEKIKAIHALEANVRNWRSLLAYGRIGSDSKTLDTFQEKYAAAEAMGYDEEGSLDRLGANAPAKQLRIRKRMRNTDSLREAVDSDTGRIGQQAKLAVRSLVLGMVSLCDKVIDEAGEQMDRQTRSEVKQRRSELSGWVTKQNQKTLAWVEKKRGQAGRVGEGAYSVKAKSRIPRRQERTERSKYADA